jgi:hypothetical protein
MPEKLYQYSIAVDNMTRNGSIASGNVMPLTKALGAFALMYRHHAAREEPKYLLPRTPRRPNGIRS